MYVNDATGATMAQREWNVVVLHQDAADNALKTHGSLLLIAKSAALAHREYVWVVEACHKEFVAHALPQTIALAHAVSHVVPVLHSLARKMLVF